MPSMKARNRGLILGPWFPVVNLEAAGLEGRFDVRENECNIEDVITRKIALASWRRQLKRNR
jgi:hypothetical protein